MNEKEQQDMKAGAVGDSGSYQEYDRKPSAGFVQRGEMNWYVVQPMEPWDITYFLKGSPLAAC